MSVVTPIADKLLQCRDCPLCAKSRHSGASRSSLHTQPKCTRAVAILWGAASLSSLLRRQSGFRETLGNPPDVFFPLEWLPGEMFAKGVFWIDLFEFTPNRSEEHTSELQSL